MYITERLSVMSSKSNLKVQDEIQFKFKLKQQLRVDFKIEKRRNELWSTEPPPDNTKPMSEQYKQDLLFSKLHLIWLKMLSSITRNVSLPERIILWF